MPIVEFNTMFCGNSRIYKGKKQKWILQGHQLTDFLVKYVLSSEEHVPTTD